MHTEETAKLSSHEGRSVFALFCSVPMGQGPRIRSAGMSMRGLSRREKSPDSPAPLADSDCREIHYAFPTMITIPKEEHAMVTLRRTGPIYEGKGGWLVPTGCTIQVTRAQADVMLEAGGWEEVTT